MTTQSKFCITQVLIGSIGDFADKTPLSEEWISMVLIPLIGNSEELVSGIRTCCSKEDMLTHTIEIVIDSSAVRVQLYYT